MATPSEKLATSLAVLRELQEHGVVAIRSRDVSRTHRERLRREGFLQEVIKGWYIAARPDEPEGESAAWYASFWHLDSAIVRHSAADSGPYAASASRISCSPYRKYACAEIRSPPCLRT